MPANGVGVFGFCIKMRYHGLVPWSLTFAAKQKNTKGSDATGLPRGVSCLLLISWQREPPRRKAVASISA